MVPAMIYIIGMPIKLIPGTSLFVTVFISALVTVLHVFNYGSIDLILVIILIVWIYNRSSGRSEGWPIFRQLSSKNICYAIMHSSNSSKHDTFFFDGVKNIKQAEIINVENLNDFSKFIFNLNDTSPLLYGSFAIILAIVLGVLASGFRQLLSKYRHIFLINKKSN